MSCLYCWQGTGLEGYSTARDAVISNKAEMLINKIVAGCCLNWSGVCMHVIAPVGLHLGEGCPALPLQQE